MPPDSADARRGGRLSLAVALTGLAVWLAGVGAYLALDSRVSSLERVAYDMARQILRTQSSLEDYLSTGQPEFLRSHRVAMAELERTMASSGDACRAIEAPDTAAQDAVRRLADAIRDWKLFHVEKAIGLRLSDSDRNLAALRGMRERGVPAGYRDAIGRRLDQVMGAIDKAISALRARTALRRRFILATALAGLILMLAGGVAFVRRYVAFQRFLRQRSARLEALADFADRMHHLVSADQAAKALVAAVGEDRHRATVLFRIPKTPGMRIAAHTGDLLPNAGDSPVLSDRAACMVMRTGTRFLLRNPATQPPCECPVCASTDSGYVCAPLLAQGGMAGLVNWQAGPGRSPGAADPGRIEELARVTSLALTNLFSLEGAMHDAVTDQLTGVANRRFLDGYLGKQFQISLRQGRPLGLLMLDLDRFKMFNDANGHLAGDAVLRAAARTAVAAVREGDLVARYGGEEFVVVLPDADVTASLEIAERIRAGVEAMRVDGLPSLRPPVITVSIGAAVAPANGRTVQAAMHAADDALYAAKEAGRNRIETARRPAGS